jgi:kinesin family protein 14
VWCRFECILNVIDRKTKMALPLQTTPKAHFVPQKKLRVNRTPAAAENPEHFVAPITPKNFATPKSITNGRPIVSTPECYNTVTFETPNLSLKRRSSQEKFDQVSNLTVAVRIRPMNAKELACVGAADIVRVQNQELIIRSNPLGNSAMSLDHIFHYDHIFWSCDETSPSFSNQEDVFLTIGKPLLNSAFRGYNACLFAYGQTGSGKSFSMMGRNMCEITDIDSHDFSGITPRFCRDLFERISKLDSSTMACVEVSYFEIYNEKIHDLLAISNSINKMPLKVREHPEWGPHVVDLSVHVVKSYSELRNWLLLGNKNRATAATSMNDKSSRSHSIFSIELCLTEDSENTSSRRSKVSLVDLAGSERLGSSHNSDEKIRQGVSINKSLLTLGKVISALADQKKNQFVPYRDSVLTWLLKVTISLNFIDV